MSTRRVDSSTSGPLISRPSWAPRPVPTISAVGVASPSAHGQAMISTATAAVNANVALSPVPSQKPSVATASAMTTGTNTPETRSARRCTGALPVCASVDEPGDLRQRGVGADLGRADDQPAAGVDRRARDLGARADLDRHRLAGQHAHVDRRAALLDDAVGGDLLAGADDEARRRPRARSIGDAALGAVGVEDRDVLGAELEQRLQRGAGAALGARLEVAAGEDERGDDRGRLEVDLVGARARRRGSGRTPSACPVMPASPKNSAYSDHSQAASVPSEISVSIVAAPWRRFAQAARWNGQAPQSTTGVASVAAPATASCRTAAPGSSRAAAPAATAAPRGSAGRAAARSRPARSARLAGVGARAAPPGSRRPRPRSTSCSGATAAGSKSTAAFSVA